MWPVFNGGGCDNIVPLKNITDCVSLVGCSFVGRSHYSLGLAAAVWDSFSDGISLAFNGLAMWYCVHVSPVLNCHLSYCGCALLELVAYGL